MARDFNTSTEKINNNIVVLTKGLIQKSPLDDYILKELEMSANMIYLTPASLLRMIVAKGLKDLKRNHYQLHPWGNL